MKTDLDNKVAALGLVGVAVTVMSAEGRFNVVDLIVGATLLLIVVNVADGCERSLRFCAAFSAVFGVCSILVFGMLIEALRPWLNVPFLIFVVWLAVTVAVYFRVLHTYRGEAE
ncbi:MAG: hypothetical protein E1N59_1913 [Puniceicoccaceae bacterium 5H]|nr:MAG: hypothetical protein E1N59_1913 [Puniceicoccaceae bacterium 5H]